MVGQRSTAARARRLHLPEDEDVVAAVDETRHGAGQPARAARQPWGAAVEFPCDAGELVRPLAGERAGKGGLGAARDVDAEAGALGKPAQQVRPPVLIDEEHWGGGVNEATIAPVAAALANAAYAL